MIIHYLEFILEVLILKFILKPLVEDWLAIVATSLVFFILFWAIFKSLIVLLIILQQQFPLLKVLQRIEHLHHLHLLVLITLPSFTFTDKSHLVLTCVGLLRRSVAS
jgi:hypothetical protein